MSNGIYDYIDDVKERLAEKDRRIADLEAKLAESEIRSKESEIFYKRETNRRDTKLRNIKQQLAEMTEKYNACQEARKLEIEFNQQDKAELKQQLTEKEKEIETLKKCGDTEHFYGLLEDKRKENKILIKAIEQANQDKISFAVEQLEKVKEYLTKELENVTELLDPLEYEDYHEFLGCGRGYKNSIEEIDNQIKQLKEQQK